MVNNIKNQILCFIEQKYHKKYVGKLWVNKLEPLGFQVKFGLNNNDKPLVISAELPEKEFLKFIKQEIHDRRMDFVQYFTGYRYYPDNILQ